MKKNIGTLTGKILVFGGVYSNLEALEKMVEIAIGQGCPPSNIICTGDIVAYCADPERCIQEIKSWGIHVIAGNVEIQLREGADDCGCNFNDGSRCDLFSKQWYPYAQAQISTASMEFLQQLPDHLTFRYAGKQVTVVHGTFFETSGYIFESTPWREKEKNLQAAASDIILAGHCGLPFSDEKAGQFWLNAGVIGMPANDGTTRVWYMTLEEQKGELTYEHHSFEYDFQATQRKMKANNLPPQYAETLGSGLWDNCEILPKEETEQQGKRLLLDQKNPKL